MTPPYPSSSFQKSKMICSQFKSRITKQGGNGKQSKNESESLVSKPNVNEEYMEVFRTNSYIEIHRKLQARLLRKSLDRLSLSSSVSHLDHTKECAREIVSTTIENLPEIPSFLTGFFMICFDARRICELILKSIKKARDNYSPMRKLLQQLRSVSDDEMDNYTDYQFNKIYTRLAAFSSLSNPLSSVTPVQFQDLHDNLCTAVDLFTSNCRSIGRKRKIIKSIKQITKGILMAAYSAVSVTLIVVAIHSIVGAVAAPCLIASSAALLTKQVRHTTKWEKRSRNQRLESQLDAAGRGFYLMMNDFDTMSRLVMRFNDEMEHSKFIAGLCLRKRNNEMLKEVVKELRVNGNGINSHLEDLEEHVYLCILNLDRSRRLLMDKLVAE